MIVEREGESVSKLVCGTEEHSKKFHSRFSINAVVRQRLKISYQQRIRTTDMMMTKANDSD